MCACVRLHVLQGTKWQQHVTSRGMSRRVEELATFLTKVLNSMCVSRGMREMGGGTRGGDVIRGVEESDELNFDKCYVVSPTGG